MTGYLPKDLQDQVTRALRQSRRRKATRVVHVGDDVFPILDFSDLGFAVDAQDAPHLRGLVDISEGSRHLTRALIVASAEDGDLMRYEFKRNTPAIGTAPTDYESDLVAPERMLPRD